MLATRVGITADVRGIPAVSFGQQRLKICVYLSTRPANLTLTGNPRFKFVCKKDSTILLLRKHSST